MPTQDRHWTLQGRPKGKRRKKDEDDDISIQQCPNCFAVFTPCATCPECGEALKVKARPRPEEIGGELVELTAEVKKAKRMEVGAARTIDDLKAIAKERGYKPGWLYHMAVIKKITK